jgi:hypothetical protein
MGKPLPTPAEISEKWSRRASGAAPDYRAGAEKATWKAEAIAGEAAYKSVMADVIAKELRKKGIEKVSDEVWKKGITEKGEARYSQGVTAETAKTAMQSGIAPVIAAIADEKGKLPPRGPRGDPKNWTRSQQLGMRLHADKVKRKGG